MDKTVNYRTGIHRKVIIDTDGGIDDMRSIVLMLSSVDSTILAITVSNGILPAEDSYRNVVNLCHHLGREDIPVGICRNNSFIPAQYTMARRYNWGPHVFSDAESAPDSNGIVQSVVDAGHDDITLVCLGGLTMAMSALCQVQGFKNVLHELVWSAVSLDDTCGLNYTIDQNASRFILGQHLPITIVKRYRIGDNRFFNRPFIDQLGSVNNTHAQTIWESLTREYMKDHTFVFTAADEMVALYLIDPSCFTQRSKGCIHEYTPFDTDGLRANFIEMLACKKQLPAFA